MELSLADERLRAAREKLDREYEAQVAQLNREQAALVERQGKLDEKKLGIARENGDLDAADDDLIEINAGGKIIAAKRCTLTQVKGTRLEALFSGRWDKKLLRDGQGRIFLDVNPDCFRAIVDYLNEMAISSGDNPPTPPRVDDEHKYILRHQMDLFGLSAAKMSGSIIIKDEGHMSLLHGWLEEDGSNGELQLLYRGSRDGLSAEAFHSNCDDKGSTLTIVETVEGFVVGGYSNVPWKNSSFAWVVANKAFLFALSGPDISSPRKLKLKNTRNGNAVQRNPSNGPSFGSGHDFYVDYGKGKAGFYSGSSYQPWPSVTLTTESDSGGGYVYLDIKEMEVFQVSGEAITKCPATANPHKRQKVDLTKAFTEDINKAIDTKKKALVQAESELLHLEDCFEKESSFMAAVASDDKDDIILLNVSGTEMATKRCTLQSVEDSVLAQQFDDTKWTEQNSVKDWTPNDVCTWVGSIDGIPAEAADLFKENEINGPALLALGVNGLKMIGIKNAGTVCLILDGIKKLNVTLIEHSPYCFGKILDYLRWKLLHSQGLAEDPMRPVVRDSQKCRFEKVVHYYFPGDDAMLLLG